MAFIFCHHPCWFYLFRYMRLLLCIQLSTGVKLKNKSIQNLWSRGSSPDMRLISSTKCSNLYIEWNQILTENTRQYYIPKYYLKHYGLSNKELKRIFTAIECNIITSIIHSKSWKGRERVVKKYDTQRPHVDPRQSMGEGTEKK